MRQYRFDFSDKVGLGLVKENPTSVNNKGFVRLQNLYPREGCLRYLPPFETAQVPNEQVDSELFQIGDHIYGVNPAGVLRLDQVNRTFDLKAYLPHLTDIKWSVADYTRFGIIQDGTNAAFVMANGDVQTEQPFLYPLPRARSMINLHGQLILGGITQGWNGLDEGFVAWSKIGGAPDFTVDKTNETGWRCPNLGTIQAVLPLNSNFVAIGDRGLGIFFPAEQTFGYKQLSSQGIDSQWKCCSNGEEIYYIDTDGVLNRLVEGQQIVPLGYSWLFKDRTCRMHWSAGDGELRICVNNQKTYCLNQYGMYETNLAILGSATLQGGKSIAMVYGTTEMADAYFELSPQNAGVSGLISVTEVYVNDSTPCPRFISIAAIKGNKEFYSREYKVSDIHTASPHVTAEAYRLRYRVPAYVTENATISDIKIQTVKPDGRFGRGYQPSQMPAGG